MNKTVLIILATGVFLLLALNTLGLWRGSGNLVDFVMGQFPANPRDLAGDASLLDDAPVIEANAIVSLDTPINEVSPAYLSFAIDASQVVGGKWWNPEAATTETGSGTVHAPVFNFNQSRLDTLTTALTPAYLRIGGSESDKIYYAMDNLDPWSDDIPDGYESVMTRPQWDAVNAFAQRNRLDLVFTLNAGPSARDTQGVWDGANAESLIRYSAEQNYVIALWELGNELDIFWFVHGFDAQIKPEQYHQDMLAAKAIVNEYDEDARFSGQGSAIWPVLGEPLGLLYAFEEDYLKLSGDLTNFVSWHYYPQQSRRGPIASRRASPSRLLNPKNLDEAAYWADRLAGWRDAYAPDAPLWLGETGNAQFGGEPGLSDVYLGGLWWLDQLGLLAQHHHDVVVRQTLVGMDYGMIDGDTLVPRPDYWNSLLWKQLMGTSVYDTDVNGTDKVRVYAHNLASGEGLTVLAINLNHDKQALLMLPQFEDQDYAQYQITTPDIFGKVVLLNGQPLNVDDDGQLPEINGVAFAGNGIPRIRLNPLSYTFIVFEQ